MGAWIRACLAKLQVPPFILEILSALSLAVLVWLYARSRDQETMDHVMIPLQIQLASTQRQQFELEVQGQRRVPVSFTGPPSRMRELRRKLQRGLIEISLNYDVTEEHSKDNGFRDTLRIENTHVPVPPGVQVEISEDARRVTVSVWAMVERQLPVRLENAGEVRVSQIKLEPATVMVRGPKELLERAKVMPTLPCALPVSAESEGHSESTVRGQVELVCKLEGRSVQVTPRNVAYRCRVQPRIRFYELTDVPVHFMCPPDYRWRPRFPRPDMGKINLRLVGPATDEPPPVAAFVDLTGGTAAKGRNLEPVRLQLPRDFQLADEAPPVVPFELEELEPRTAKEPVEP